MRYYLSAFVCFLFISFKIQAQDTEEDYELKGNEKPGFIVNKKGQKLEGIVKLANPQSPWVNQKYVKFIALDEIDNAKKKQKFKKMDADDIKEFMAYDGDRQRHFEIIKYTNFKEGINTANGGLSGGLKTLKNMTTSDHLAEKVLEGKIEVYILYGYPTSFAAGNEQIKNMEEETERLRNYPSFIYSKDGSKLKEFKYKDVPEIVSDCKVVKSKLENGEYLSYPKDEKEKKSKLGKLIKNEISDALSNKMAIVTEMYTDYNISCK